MSEDRCPPHLAVLDHADKLVCQVCGVDLPDMNVCLGCVVQCEGWRARHTCKRDRRDRAITDVALFILAVAIFFALFAGRL